MAITLTILETKLSEKDLFLKLVMRGRHADIPYYFSVHSYVWGDGWVIFEQLDCAPTHAFRVAVAGNLLIVSKKDFAEVSQWLAEWQVEFNLTEEVVETPRAAHALLKKLRDQAPLANIRWQIGESVAKEIIAFNRASDDEMLTRRSK